MRMTGDRWTRRVVDEDRGDSLVPEHWILHNPNFRSRGVIEQVNKTMISVRSLFDVRPRLYRSFARDSPAMLDIDQPDRYDKTQDIEGVVPMLERWRVHSTSCRQYHAFEARGVRGERGFR